MTYITACKGNFPCYDRTGRRIAVGDRIRFQHCTGIYGQTRIDEATVTDAHYPYGNVHGAQLEYDFGTATMRGYHCHHDVDHGHETWVEVLSQETAA